MDRLNPKALDLLTDKQRWSIANALRSAAERYKEAAEMPEMGTLQEQFTKQAAEALSFAEQFEDC